MADKSARGRNASAASAVCCAKRKCAAINCQNTELNSSMHRFPSVYQRHNDHSSGYDRDKVKRCRLWVKYSGNANLLSRHPENLSKDNGMYLCHDHFSNEDKSSKSDKYIKRNAVPTVCVNPLSELDMEKFDFYICIKNEDPGTAGPEISPQEQKTDSCVSHPEQEVDFQATKDQGTVNPEFSFQEHQTDSRLVSQEQEVDFQSCPNKQLNSSMDQFPSVPEISPQEQKTVSCLSHPEQEVDFRATKNEDQGTVNPEFSFQEHQTDSCLIPQEQVLQSKVASAATAVCYAKRKCAAINCQNNELNSSMHRFPSVYRRYNDHSSGYDRDKVKRCRLWVKYSGNANLLSRHPENLSKGMYLCHDHFSNEDKSLKSDKYIKRNAVPTVCANPLSELDMDKFDFYMNAKSAGPEISSQDHNTDSHVSYQNLEVDSGIVTPTSLVKSCSESLIHQVTAGIAISPEVQVTDCSLLPQNQQIGRRIAPLAVLGQSGSGIQIQHQMTASGTISPQVQVNDSSLLHQDQLSDLNIDGQTPNRREIREHNPGTKQGDRPPSQRVRIRRKCCAPDCVNNNLTSRLFSFPSIFKKKEVHLVSVELNRFKIWIKNVGLSKLLLFHPANVSQRFHLCSLHFQPNFLLPNGSLTRTAVPTLFFKSSLLPAKFAHYVEKLAKLIGPDPNESLDLFNPKFEMGSKFEDEMKNLEWNTCDNCHETFLVSSTLASPPKCLHGKNCVDYTSCNDMDPGDVPEELADLTFVEEQLIARVHPFVVMFKLKRLQYGYSGNVISFPQAVQEIATELPRRVKDLTSVVNVKFSSEVVKDRQFQVRAGKVLNALQWLKTHNPFYEDIEISTQNIESLPEDGNVYDELISFAVEDGVEKGKDGGKPTSEDKSEEVSTCEEIRNCQSEMTGTDDNYGTNLQFSSIPITGVPHQDKQIDSCLEWPTMDRNPADEFNSEGRVVCSFPTLFPYGRADLRSARTKTKVSDANYFKHLMRYKDRRFARHPTFRFFALNSLMRWSALRDGSIFIRRNEEYSNVTKEDLKKILQENPGFRYKLMFQGSNLRGTRAYWNARSNELKDLVEQLTVEKQRLPTLFFTLSPADLHWPDLYRLLSPDKDVDALTEGEWRKLLQDNPMIVDEFFDLRVKAFLKHVIEPAFGVEDYWYRVEYQHRGSPHVHGLLWLRDAPDVRNLETASAQKQAEAIEYFNQFVTAVNPDPQCPISDDHPSRVRFEDIVDPEQDLAQLLRTVQRHTRCSRVYCMRINKKTGREECRFKFPKEITDTSSFRLNENGILEFVPARNDELLNKFNEVCMRYWRANLDISPVSSEKSLIAYIAKYIAKCETQSQSYDELFSSILNTVGEVNSCKKFAQRYLIRTCAERDFSAQEVCHLLLGRKLYSAGSRTFTYVNLSSDQQWIPLTQTQNNGEQNQEATGSSFVKKYKHRPSSHEEKTLWEAASSFNVKSWQPRKKKSIVILFPKYHLQDDDTQDDNYYRQMVLLHCPWRDEESLIQNKTWKELYVEKDIQSHIGLQCTLDGSDAEDDYEESNEEDESRLNEQWMIAARLAPAQQVPEIELGLRECDTAFDWYGTLQNYAHCGSIKDMTQFLESKKKEMESDDTPTAELPNVRFNEEQTKVKELIQKQIDSFRGKTDDGTLPKRVIIQGKAGTGKSLLIKYLTHTVEQALGKKAYSLLASTGIAALNINGQTVHSFFSLPKDSGKFEDLKGEAARTLTEKLRDVKFLIIDEFSMIGSTMLAMIDKRCRQGTGALDKDFGGLIIYLLGDIRQLPPVLDNPLYASNQRTLLAKHGKVMFDNFQVVFFLHRCYRQLDEKFLHLLNEVSVGKISEENFAILSSRVTSKVSNEEKKHFETCLRLFSTRGKVHQYNMDVLENLQDETSAPVPVARIPAKHNCRTAAAAEADDADGLGDTLYLAKGCQVMLRKNIWTSRGLVNGALGTVIDILYETDKIYPHDPPTIILCSFESYKGPSLIPGTKLVPITRVSANWTSGRVKCTRVQFPLSVSYACSIHKSQGMTLDKAIVNIGDREFSLGLTYVALSRVKTLKGLLVDPVCYDRIAKLEKSPLMAARNIYEEVLKSKSRLMRP